MFHFFVVMPKVYRCFPKERLKSDSGMDCAVVLCFLGLKSPVRGVLENQTR